MAELGLGPEACSPDAGQVIAGSLRATGQSTGRQQAKNPRRVQGSTRKASRHWWLLHAKQEKGRRGHAPQRHFQCTVGRQALSVNTAMKESPCGPVFPATRSIPKPRSIPTSTVRIRHDIPKGRLRPRALQLTGRADTAAEKVGRAREDRAGGPAPTVTAASMVLMDAVKVLAPDVAKPRTVSQACFSAN